MGNEEVIELLTTAFLAGGHVLLEGVPGVAKTTIARSFAAILGLSFKRIQLTPDLLPADILGTVYYDMKRGEFSFKKGPIFTNIVLADEINRAQPKTQSALLEAMQERHVTIEGITYPLPEPFLLLATRNPVEIEGVYPLPEAQLDRFLMHIEVGYPNEEDEVEMLLRKDRNIFASAGRVFDPADILIAIENVRTGVKTSEPVLRYIRKIVQRTREDDRVILGASPRASEHLLYASKSYAYLNNRDYVIPDDVKKLAEPVLAHRIILKGEYEVEGISGKDIVREILEEVEVPV